MSETERTPKKIIVWANYDKVEQRPDDSPYRKGWGIDADDFTTVQQAREHAKTLPNGTEYHICTSHQFGTVKHETAIKL